MLVNCLYCGIEFKTKPCLVKIGKGKYHIKACYDKSLIGRPNSSNTKFKFGQIVHNKGKSPSEQTRRIMSQSQKKRFEIEIPYQKNKKFPQFSGENASNWKGEEAGSHAKHAYMTLLYGKPQFCEGCGTEEEKRYYNWANISGEYFRDKEDWIRLCKKCHNRFDDVVNKSWRTKKERLMLNI